MKAPRRARPAPRHARELSMTPYAAPERRGRPPIRITVTVELPGRLTLLLTATAAVMHLLRRGW